jgi:conjugative transposon TraN protein
MKKQSLFFVFSVILFVKNIQAQGIIDTATQHGIHFKTAAITGRNLVRYFIPLKKTTHFLSPEPILYVDISSPNVEGDLPEKNIFRLKPNINIHVGDNFQVTIVTASFVAVYDLTLNDSNDEQDNAYVINMDPNDAVQTNNYNQVGQQDFCRLSMLALTKRKKNTNLVSHQYGMGLTVNNIYIVGDFLLFDISCRNRSKISYAIDDIRFKLQDKRKVNAHVSQEIELKPIYQFYDTENATIHHKWRNFYLFRKFTYPGGKVLNIEMTEKQISSRKVELNVDYGHVLHSEFLL